MNFPAELKYTKSHEWVREEDGEVVVGITEHAQDALGDIVHVELPEVGEVFEREGACCEVESVKAVSDVYCPVSGEIVAVNEGLEDAPEQVNEDPYKGGWLFRVSLSDAAELGELLSAEEYAAVAAD